MSTGPQIPTLSSKVPTEIKNAFQAIKDYFRTTAATSSTSTTDLTLYYTKAQSDARFAPKILTYVYAQTGEKLGAYVTAGDDGSYYIEWRVIT